jgi:hypothetical protein
MKKEINKQADVEIKGKKYTFNYPSLGLFRRFSQICGLEAVKNDISKIDWVEVLQKEEQCQELVDICLSDGKSIKADKDLTLPTLIMICNTFFFIASATMANMSVGGKSLNDILQMNQGKDPQPGIPLTSPFSTQQKAIPK